MRAFFLWVLLCSCWNLGLAQSPPVREGTILAFLWHDSPNDLKALEGFRQGMEVLGLARRLEVAHAKRDPKAAAEILTAAAAEPVALCAAFGTESARLARAHMKNVPVVFTAVTNPVLSGIARGWKGAGGNVAGNSNWLDRRAMLKAFREAIPEMRRLAVIRTAGNAVSDAEVVEAKAAVSGMKDFDIVDVVVGKSDDLGAKLDEAFAKADALWLPIDFQLYQEEPLRLIMESARARRIPVVSSTLKAAGAGALIVVTVDYELLGLKAAGLVKRILKDGASPGDLPIGRLKSAEIYVDLGAARLIGRQVPLDLVFRAHRILGVETR
ncbi:MAG TPA: hypothetical protein ENK43_05360 [Planctomycetes bacterium]|nr:hypothetical protein [Planctomycetota bacterium]